MIFAKTWFILTKDLNAKYAPEMLHIESLLAKTQHEIDAAKQQAANVAVVSPDVYEILSSTGFIKQELQ